MSSFDAPFKENRKTTYTRTLCCMNSQNTMAHEVSLANQDIKTNATIERFLELVQTETKEEVDKFLLPLIRTAENERNSQRKTSEQLEEALAQSDVVEVWKLIAKINETNSKNTDSNKTNSKEADSNETISNETDSKKTDRNETNSNKTDSNKTLENINEVCKTIAKRENNNENGCHFKCSWDCKKDELEGTAREMRSEEERRWIEILSNPLYISLEWLWRNNPNSHYKTEGLLRRKESKFADIIEAALDDAYLLEKITSYEHYYSRDEYKRRAEEYETFAADIVEQVDASDLNQLHEIMDIKGNGSLLNQTSANYNQSLSLLKLAADKKRKRVGIRLNSNNIKLYSSIFRRNISSTFT